MSSVEAPFPSDPFDPAEIGKILADPQRSYEQRELVKTYYGECKPTGTASLLSEPVRRKLVDILADRLDKLAGTPMHYGEQRLFVHLISAEGIQYKNEESRGAKSRRAAKREAES